MAPHRFAMPLIALAFLSAEGRGMLFAQVTVNDAPALQRRAEALRGEQRLSEARDVYRILVARDSHDYENRFWLAKLEGWTGHLGTAESLYVQLLAERPDDYDSRIGLADVLIWSGSYDAAQANLERLERTYPDNAEVLSRLDRVRALRHEPSRSRWEMGVEYYGDQLTGAAASNGGTASMAVRPSDALRLRAEATVQQKFARTEARGGGELGHRLGRSFELRGAAFLAPGAEVLPRQTYGFGVATKLGSGLVLYGDYTFLDFSDARVHQISPRLELYAGPHWFVSGRYGYASTRFDGLADAVGNHAGAVSIGYVYGLNNSIQIFGGAGGEAFALPSRDAIGGFSAHTVGIGWRQFLTPWLGLTASYANQNRSNGAKQDSYGLGLVRRW